MSEMSALGKLLADFDVVNSKEYKDNRISELEEQLLMKDNEIKHLKEKVEDLEKRLNHKESVGNTGTMRGYNTRIPKETEDKVVIKYNSGKSIVAIKDELGIARGTVYNVLRRRGLK